MAAAEVMNRAEGLRSISQMEDRQRIVGLFADQALIDWQGQRTSLGLIEAADFWTRKLSEVAPSHLFIRDIEGLSSEKVRLVGFLSRSVQPPGDKSTEYYTAPVDLLWVFAPAQEWEIQSATVGQWQRER